MRVRESPLVSAGRMMCKRETQRLRQMVGGASAKVAEIDDKGLDDGRDRQKVEEGTSRWWK